MLFAKEIFIYDKNKYMA